MVYRHSLLVMPIINNDSDTTIRIGSNGKDPMRVQRKCISACGGDLLNDGGTAIQIGHAM